MGPGVSPERERRQLQGEKDIINGRVHMSKASDAMIRSVKEIAPKVGMCS